MALGPQRRLGAVRHPDALVDRGEVGLDRALGDAEPLGDLLVEQALVARDDADEMADGANTPDWSQRV